MTIRLAAVKDAKANLVYQSERLSRAVAAKREIVEDSENTRETVKEQGIYQVMCTMELYERWEMRVEELIQLLARVNCGTLAAAEVVKRTAPVIPLMQREKGKWRQLEEVMGICLELLSETVEFYEKNQERTTFIVSR